MSGRIQRNPDGTLGISYSYIAYERKMFAAGTDAYDGMVKRVLTNALDAAGGIGPYHFSDPIEFKPAPEDDLGLAHLCVHAREMTAHDEVPAG